jgi:hypothetical protein
MFPTRLKQYKPAPQLAGSKMPSTPIAEVLKRKREKLLQNRQDRFALATGTESERKDIEPQQE